MVAKREHFSDVLLRGLGRPTCRRAATPAPATVCLGCGHPNDAHPGGPSPHRACAVCIWEVDMGHRREQECCQRSIPVSPRQAPHHLR